MFEYLRMKAELEQVQCPQHGKNATANFINGKVSLENICCEEHRKKLNKVLPEIEDGPDVADILEHVF